MGVWGQDGMELTFPMARSALCFVFSAEKMLTMHQCPVTAEQCWYSTKAVSQHSPLSSRAGVVRVSGGDTTRTGAPSWAKGYSIRHLISNKSWEKEHRDVSFIIKVFVIRSTCCTYSILLPWKCLALTRWWKVENKTFVSLFFCMQPLFFFIKLPLCQLASFFNFFPYLSENREWESILMVTWQPAKVNWPQPIS